MFHRSTIIAALALGVTTLATAQQQQPPLRYSRDNCVKVREGKTAEYVAFLRDVTIKLGKSRVESGEQRTFIVGRVVVPSGRAAHCDYHIVNGYDGFPPETNAERTTADLKRAGINMTRDQMIAKRDELSYLVSTETLRRRDGVGSSKKDAYARLDYYKVKQSNMQDWLQIEQRDWKPVFDMANKENPGMTWSLSTLALQNGSDLAFNAMTVNGYPDWETVGKGSPLRPVWNKVHPQTDITAATTKVNAIGELIRTEWVKFIEVARKQQP